MHVRLTRLIFSLLAILFLLPGCDPASERAELVFLNGAEPETLDPALITGQPEGRLVNTLFEGLTTFNQRGEAQPGVAERWKISADKKTYTFFLRKEARWSNGDTVTAHDFVESWRRTLAPETASDYSYQLYYVRNAKLYSEGKLKDPSQIGVRALDDYTLEVHLENPTPFFLDLCAFVTLFPVHMPTVKARPDDWIKPEHIVSNGAYILKKWRVNDRIRFEKNPYYWNRENVAMRSIEALPVSNANTAYNFYAEGLADLIMDKGLTPVMLLDELKKRPDFHSAPYLGNYFLRFNASRPPFKDARVRKAFALVVDKERIVTKITRAGETPASSLVPPGAGGYEPPEGLSRNPDLARQLLAEAGYPDGKGFPIIAYLYNESEANQSVAIELQSMFRKELGVEMTLKRQEWKVYLRSSNNLEYDICRASWIGDYNDPNTFLDMFLTGGGNNRTGWGNPKYDTLIDAAAKEMDPQRRFDIFRKAEQLLISEEAPICPLYYYVGIQFYDGSRLGGIEANLLDEHPLKSMYWKK